MAYWKTLQSGEDAVFDKELVFDAADIRPMIRSISFRAEEEALALHALISAAEPTLNPELLSGALRQLQPELAPDFASYCRIETFQADGKIFR